MIILTVLSMMLQTAAAAPQADCKKDSSGNRHALRCDLTHSAVGQTWNANSVRGRKLFVSKPSGETGIDIVHLWLDGHKHTIEIKPGEEKQLFRKHRNSAVNARVVVETKELGSSGTSTLYAHFEWLRDMSQDNTQPCAQPKLGSGNSFCVSRPWDI